MHFIIRTSLGVSPEETWTFLGGNSHFPRRKLQLPYTLTPKKDVNF